VPLAERFVNIDLSNCLEELSKQFLGKNLLQYGEEKMAVGLSSSVRLEKYLASSLAWV
jgi:hypothetical protein